MKSPPVQYADPVARDLVEDFIAGRSSRPAGNGAAPTNGHGLDAGGVVFGVSPLRHQT
jgi:hypothetical protein